MTAVPTPADEVRAVVPDRRPAGFTQQHLDWVPWIEPIALADADADQQAVLDGFRAESPYFRLLARDPAVLRERSAVDKAIFYGHGGLPRAERELTATVTSRLNGCVYCASVHSALSSQLSGRTGDVQRLLDEGVEVRIDERRDAITDFAAALADTPPRAEPGHVARLRELGLSDLEISDIVHAAAFFSWANRLMLTLGEPEVPETG
jgi:alkylhydroperoxidase domain protein